RLDLPLRAALPFTTWESLASTNDLVTAKTAGLLRIDAHDNATMWPRSVYDRSLRDAAAKRLARGTWGELCVEAERRNLFDDVIDALSPRAFAAAVARSVEDSSLSLHAVGAREALF